MKIFLRWKCLWNNAEISMAPGKKKILTTIISLFRIFQVGELVHGVWCCRSFCRFYRLWPLGLLLNKLLFLANVSLIYCSNTTHTHTQLFFLFSLFFLLQHVLHSHKLFSSPLPVALVLVSILLISRHWEMRIQ